MGLYILLDGIPSYNFPFCLTERPIIPGTKQEIDKQQLPHRDGSLVIKRGFLDRPISLEFNILENRNIKHDVRLFKAYFFDKKTLQFSDDDVYYKINSVEIDEFENEIEEYGIGTVKFDLEPFDYACIDPIIVSNEEKLVNLGTHEALPKIVIKGKGDITLMFNSQKVQLIGISDYVVLDSDLLIAYRKNDESMDEKMIGEFPIFKEKYIKVSWTGNISELKIEPRWRFK